jgi:cation transporter-like permease
MNNDIMESKRNQHVAPERVEITPNQEALLIENQRLRQELEIFKSKVQDMRRQQNIQEAASQINTENERIQDSSFDYVEHEGYPEFQTGTLHENTEYNAFQSSESEATKDCLMIQDTKEDGIQRDYVSFDEESFVQSIADRSSWLVGLLVLQSMSSFIIARNEELLQNHAVIVQFLTMLVGAGGNAGNQAAVRVIRGLAVGQIDHTNTRPFLQRELAMGLCLSLILGLSGFLRALVFFVPWPETFAITISLLIIVASSVFIGALLPLGMRTVGIDPAHSSTTIQVIMDILGVLITVHICGWILDSLVNNYRML